MLFFFSRKYDNAVCEAVEIVIKDSSTLKLVGKEEITNFVNKYTENKTVGYNFKDIKIYELEEQLNKNPYIESAEVFRTASGILKVEVIQRRPILRIINKAGESFYIDRQGFIIPHNEKYSSYQIIANGNINLSFDLAEQDSLPNLDAKNEAHKTVYELYKVAKFINENEFFNAQIEQIYVNEKQEIELIPRVGNHVVEFGHAEDIKLKFRNLKEFYTQVTNKMGWNKYKKISVKYRDQIVGSY